MSGKSYAVPALARGLDILEWLAEARQPTSVTELSRHFALPKSSVFGLLQALTERGYVEKNEDNRYGLTLRIFALAGAMMAGMDLRQKTNPVLRELVAETNISGHVAVLDAGEAVYIDKVEAPAAIRLTTFVGRRVPLHCTALGKALLAHMPEEARNRVIAQKGLTRYTPATITSPAGIKAELHRVRDRGFAVSNEEYEPGVRGIAAAVFDHTGETAASVNLGGTVLQIKRKDVATLGGCVARAAAEMSRRLGYAGAQR